MLQWVQPQSRPAAKHSTITERDSRAAGSRRGVYKDMGSSVILRIRDFYIANEPEVLAYLSYKNKIAIFSRFGSICADKCVRIDGIRKVPG